MDEFEQIRTPFVGWMVDRILKRKHVKTRSEAVEKAWGYLQAAESDGQGGWNLMFSRDWTEEYAHVLADRGIQHDEWEAEEC